MSSPTRQGTQNHDTAAKVAQIGSMKRPSLLDHGFTRRMRLVRRAAAPARGVAVALAALLGLALAGCATPVLQPAVDVPSRFATAPASDEEPEAAWWQSFGDPVLSDLVRRAARENRDIKIAAERVRAARAGETISRSWLLPSIGASGVGVRHEPATAPRKSSGSGCHTQGARAA